MNCSVCGGKAYKYHLDSHQEHPFRWECSGCGFIMKDCICEKRVSPKETKEKQTG